MMARDPDRRLPEHDEVIGDLERYQRGQAEAMTEARREHTTAVGMLPVEQARVVVAASVLFLLVGGVVLVRASTRRPDKDPVRPKVNVVDPQAANQALYVVRRRRRRT
jgi:hypothetical protein